jgi:hypothetical protein
MTAKMINRVGFCPVGAGAAAGAAGVFSAALDSATSDLLAHEMTEQQLYQQDISPILPAKRP